MLYKFFNGVLNRASVTEGLVVGITEYAMLGAFVIVGFLINHYYSTELVGVYFLAYSIAQIGILGFGSAFSSLIRRDFCLNKYDTYDYFYKIQIIRLGNLALVFILSFFFVFYFYQPLANSLQFLLLVVMAKGFDALNETYYTVYQALNKLKEYSALKALNAISFVIVSFLSCISQKDISALYWLQLFVAIVFYAINFYWFKKVNYLPLSTNQKHLELIDYKFLMVQALPLIINTFVFQLSLRVNSILIFDEIGEKSFGVFSIIVMTIGVFTGIASALGIFFLGKMSKSFVSYPDSFTKYLYKIVLFFLMFGLISFCVYLMFSPVIEHLFKLTDYKNLYYIMSLSIPFVFVTGGIGGVFVVVSKQKIAMYLSFVVLVFNVIAYYFITNYFGLIGSGFAFLITSIFQSVILIIAIFYILRKLPLSNEINKKLV